MYYFIYFESMQGFDTLCFSHISLPSPRPPALVMTPLLEIDIWRGWDPVRPSFEGFKLL